MHSRPKPFPSPLRYDAPELHGLLAGCRLELEAMRWCVGGGSGSVDVDGSARPPGAEARLLRTGGHLEQAARALARVVDRLAASEQPAPAPVVTPALPAASLLAREADHRIRNSLQSLVGLLALQRERDGSPVVRAALHLAIGRVTAMARLHDALHRAAEAVGDAGGAVPDLDLAAYLDDLCGELGRLTDAADGPRTVEVAFGPWRAPVETARRLGLVVAELVANALRHAFAPGTAGTVRATGAAVGGGYGIEVSDDGRGLPPGFDPRAAGGGFGLRLVVVLADQMGGRLVATAGAGGHGARFALTLPPA